jgi:hypothetical protein
LVLELLQNADDCVFPDTEMPSLSFAFFDAGFVCHKNEVGFKLAEVRGLLGLCSSTKRAPTTDDAAEEALQVGADAVEKNVQALNAGWYPRPRLIGEKGIGFKSVVATAANVWVFSRGYQFRLDAKVIVPQWTERDDVTLPAT